MAGAADQRVPQVRLDQPRAARRLGLSPEHLGDPAADEPADVPADPAGARRSHAPAEQMTVRAVWRSALALLLAGLLSACGSLPFFAKDDDKAAAKPAPEGRA